MQNYTHPKQKFYTPPPQTLTILSWNLGAPLAVFVPKVTVGRGVDAEPVVMVTNSVIIVGTVTVWVGALVGTCGMVGQSVNVRNREGRIRTFPQFE